MRHVNPAPSTHQPFGPHTSSEVGCAFFVEALLAGLLIAAIAVAVAFIAGAF